MNIIVTGTNGFIGRWLIAELTQHEKDQITALIQKGSNRDDMVVNQRISIIEVDYQQDATKAVFSNQDVCFHLIGVLGKYGVKSGQFWPFNIGKTFGIIKGQMNER